MAFDPRTTPESTSADRPATGKGPAPTFTDDLVSNLIHRINVGDSLTRTADRFPDHPAIVDGDRTRTYRQFNDEVNALAHALLGRGYTRGDALAIGTENCAEFLVLYYACAKIGVVAVPLNLGWRSHEIVHVLTHSESRGIVFEAKLAGLFVPPLADCPAVTDVVVVSGPQSGDAEAALASQPVPTDRQVLGFAELVASGAAEARGASGADGTSGGGAGAEGQGASGAERVPEPEVIVDDRDALTYLYTSGTTSAPKGVVGNHSAIYLESMSSALECKLDHTDRTVALMPMFHTAQLNVFSTAAVMVGATTIVHRGFDADRLLTTIEEQRATQIFALPMMYRELLDHPRIGSTDLSSLRTAFYAMAPMPEKQLLQCLEVFGCDFYLVFGQTEMSPTTTFLRPEHQVSHNGATGTTVPNVQLGIMDAEGNLLPAGEVGEIVYRGPHALTEYLKNPEATAAAFEHGWFHSGDVGRRGEDGMLWFQDRTKDVIKTGGENVASIEVEKAIYAADPNVAEVVVVGLPHDRWSEAITAVVTAKEGATLDTEALIAKVKELIDGFKTPKDVIILDEMPRTSTGKVQKNVIREKYRDHYAERQ